MHVQPQDGETNLKIRNALDLKECEINSVEDVLALEGFLSVEPPSANLHNFQGRIHYKARTSWHWVVLYVTRS